MEDGFRLQDSKILIIGLGLMGGSLALALKGKCAALYGIDSHLPTLELALAKKIVDQADNDLAKYLSQADLVVLATPVQVILDYIRKLPSLTQKSCIVIDLGSTKAHIVAAMNALPPRFEAIGGHPICGREKLSLENAHSALYQNASFVITPTDRTTERARNAINQVINIVGAHMVEMDAEDHDRALAFTSHLPFLFASALVGTLPQEYSELIGPGFRSSSRLAGTPASMMLGVLQLNRANVLSAVHDFQAYLADLETALSTKNDDLLEAILKTTQAQYHTMVH